MVLEEKTITLACLSLGRQSLAADYLKVKCLNEVKAMLFASLDWIGPAYWLVKKDCTCGPPSSFRFVCHGKLKLDCVTLSKSRLFEAVWLTLIRRLTSSGGSLKV